MGMASLSLETPDKARHHWERNKQNWQRELTLQASLRPGVCERLTSNGIPWAKLNEPWINVRGENAEGQWGLGCRVCNQALKSSSHLVRADLATFKSVTVPRLDLLKKHQASAQHQKSVMQYLDIELGPTGLSLLGAPPLHVFTEALAGLQKGDSARRMDLGGTGDRVRNIRFCLFEALAEVNREFMGRAATMVLMRDERHGRLLLCFAACTDTLETRHGTLAVMRDYDSPTAENLVKATKQAFKQFCTLRLGKPRSAVGLEEPKTDDHLLRHMRHITEMLVSDGASSELLAADVCRGRRGCVDEDCGNDGEAFTPNVKIVGRDLAHCARHVLRKPWQADSHLAALFDATVWHKTSVVQIIDHSDVFRQWFREYTAQDSATSGLPRVSNLSSAKHRFESCSKPLSRFMLHLVAVFKTCHRIVSTRDSSYEGGLVRNWLINTSSEDLLQLALLADAADEGLLLVRQMDTEQFDIASLHSTVAHFVERVGFLFNQGGCMVVENSFVQSCLSILSAGQVQVLPHSENQEASHRRVLGKPSEDAVQRCVNRMAVWAETARAALEAEFPNFLVLHSFAVFALSDQARAVAEIPVDETHCQRLAKLFSVSPQDLASQLARVRPAAQAIKNDSKCSNHEAWRKAVQRHLKARAAHCHLAALRPVVMRYLIWSSSTSGVEQRFSIGDRLAIEKTAASQVQESLVLQAAFDKVGSLKEKRAIAERARELFVQGSPRARRARCKKVPRLDKGTKRQLKREEIDRSEVGWLRRRRCTVALGSRTAKEQQAIAPAPRRRRQEQRSCLAKQQEKKQRREEEAFQDGCLLSSEVTDELRARVVARQKKDAANDRQRRTATLRRNLKVATLSRPVPWSKFGRLRGPWVEGGLAEGDVVRRHLCKQGVATLAQADWASAELFVLRDLEICERRVLWRAALSGGWLLSDGAARGDQGIFVKFCAAVAKARRVGCGAVWRGGTAETLFCQFLGGRPASCGSPRSS